MAKYFTRLAWFALLGGWLAAYGQSGAVAKPDPWAVDWQIAEAAALLGSNRLAVDPQDLRGHLLLRFAAQVQPRGERHLLTMGLIERGLRPEPAPDPRISDASLVVVLTRRAATLLELEAPKVARAGQLSRLYYLLAEHFEPHRREVILGLKKCEVDGFSGDLGELLAEPLAADKIWQAAAPRSVPAAVPGSAAKPDTLNAINREADTDTMAPAGTVASAPTASPLAADAARDALYPTLLTSTSPAPEAAEEGEVPPTRPATAKHFRKHWYKFYLSELSWEAAQRQCEKLGGSLACISSQAENDFVVELADGDYAWIGGLANESSVWRWISGEPMTFTFWHPGQPSQGKQRFLYLWRDGKWNDSYNTNKHVLGFICEWDK